MMAQPTTTTYVRKYGMAKTVVDQLRVLARSTRSPLPEVDHVASNIIDDAIRTALDLEFFEDVILGGSQVRVVDLHDALEVKAHAVIHGMEIRQIFSAENYAAMKQSGQVRALTGTMPTPLPVPKRQVELDLGDDEDLSEAPIAALGAPVAVPAPVEEDPMKKNGSYPPRRRGRPPGSKSSTVQTSIPIRPPTGVVTVNIITDPAVPSPVTGEPTWRVESQLARVDTTKEGIGAAFEALIRRGASATDIKVWKLANVKFTPTIEE